MSEKYFIIRQCSNRHCRFRFPASVEQTQMHFCPKCGQKLVNQGEIFTNSVMPAPQTNVNKLVLSILLDNVRSALNVGSIIRTCEGIGVEHIYLCGITPTPENPKVHKTALTAETSISWSYHLNAKDILNHLKKKKIKIWSLEVSATSIPLNDALRQFTGDPILLVAGNEQSGVDPDILAMSDQIVYLPMIGNKRSLNVAVAVGAAINLLLSQAVYN